MTGKIIDFNELSKIKKKNKKKNIIHCHGVFDLIHIGHINHFKEAKNLGGILVVTITPDRYVSKGPNRPAFNERIRAEAIAAIKSVDFVTINKFSNAIKTIKVLKPSYYCKGPDYKISKNDLTGKIKDETKAIKSVGGKIYFTKSATFSSSTLLNKYSNLITNDQKKSIKSIPNKNFGYIKKQIDKFQKTKVLIIGETIIDEYCFAEALGKSGKESILMFRDIKKEQYLGGALAIANHLSGFCKSISLLSMLGEKGEFYQKIKKSLPKNIKTFFIKKKNSPTIIKKKYIDNINKNKLFGTYKINDDFLTNKNQKILTNYLKKNLRKYDLIIVSDYGHGFINQFAANFICKNAKFVAVNAQVNAANLGHNTISKYKKVHHVIINETELRQDLRNKNDKLESIIKLQSKKIGIKDIIVTRGSNGAILYNLRSNKYYHCPAFANKVLDKMGAGDSMMAFTSLCFKHKLNSNLSLLIGSLAGAQSVETMGNSKPINKLKLLKSLEHLTK